MTGVRVFVVQAYSEFLVDPVKTCKRMILRAKIVCACHAYWRLIGVLRGSFSQFARPCGPPCTRRNRVNMCDFHRLRNTIHRTMKGPQLSPHNSRPRSRVCFTPCLWQISACLFRSVSRCIHYVLRFRCWICVFALGNSVR